VAATEPLVSFAALAPLPATCALASATCFAVSAALGAAATAVGVVIAWPALARVPTAAAMAARREASFEASAAPSAYGTRLCERISELPWLEVTKEMKSFAAAAFGPAALVTR